MKRVTMRDVAKRAGVSKSTVSHVINETRFVSYETKQRVLQAIEELDYRPSKVARSLTSRRTHTVGLLISDVGNPFYHQVILGVEDVALKHDYSVFLFNASYDLERSMKYVVSMIDRQVDGALFMSSRLTKDLIAALVKHQIPAVVLDWVDVQMEGIGTLTFEFEHGIRQAVEHLLELGHTCLAHVSGPLDLWTSRARRDIFLQVLAEHGISPEQVTVVEANLDIDGGRRALRRLMHAKPVPTAIFAANDLTALGIVWEARQLGLRVPDDLSVIGLDNIELAAQITPGLTTVALPRYEIGARAMHMLLHLIEQPDGATPDTWHDVISTHLVTRASTGAPPAQSG